MNQSQDEIEFVEELTSEQVWERRRREAEAKGLVSDLTSDSPEKPANHSSLHSSELKTPNSTGASSNSQSRSSKSSPRRSVSLSQEALSPRQMGNSAKKVKAEPISLTPEQRLRIAENRARALKLQADRRQADSEAETPPPILNQKQQEVLDTVQRGGNVFVTGPAGTGKSLVLKEIIRFFQRKYKDEDGKWVVLASTGAAAIPLRGQTVHSFGGMGIPKTVKDFEKAWKEDRKSAWRNLESLIIDEASMISGELLDRLSDVVCRIRHDPNDPNCRALVRPFGGIQLIICGDLLQLPPIVKFDDIQAMQEAGVNKKNLFLNRGFIFQSQSWKDASFNVVELTEVFRQENRNFVDVLHQIRKGNATNSQVESFLKQCMRSLPATKEGIKPTNLYATNARVDDENRQQLEKIPEKSYFFNATDGYDVHEIYETHEHFMPRKGWAEKVLKENQFWDDCIAQERIELKLGAQVSFDRCFFLEDLKILFCFTFLTD